MSKVVCGKYRRDNCQISQSDCTTEILAEVQKYDIHQTPLSSWSVEGGSEYETNHMHSLFQFHSQAPPQPAQCMQQKAGCMAAIRVRSSCVLTQH